jgi:hypothetical protein
MFYLWDNFEVHNLKLCLNFSDIFWRSLKMKQLSSFTVKRFIPTIIRNFALVSFLQMLIIQRIKKKRYYRSLRFFLTNKAFFLAKLGEIWIPQ